MGSPVYFPNYKIPFLIQDIGLNVLRNIDVTTLKDQIRPVLPGKRRSRDTLIRMAADRWYDQDGSPAYAANDALYRSVVRCLKQDRIEGVVYHVLKGQIEYDFELEEENWIENRALVDLYDEDRISEVSENEIVMPLRGFILSDENGEMPTFDIQDLQETIDETLERLETDL